MWNSFAVNKTVTVHSNSCNMCFEQTLLLLSLPSFSVGVVLTVRPTANILEFSNMTRELCVELVDFGQGLERDVLVDLQFLAEGYAREGIIIDH